MATRILFARPRFSDDHGWDEVVAHFPPELGEVVIETTDHGDALQRLTAEGPAIDVLVPIMSPVPAEVFERGLVGMVQQFGVGVERIDLDAAADNSIWVANMPGLNAPFVAEHALALMLSLMHRLPEAGSGFVEGGWGAPAGRSLFGSEVCVIGLGAIGGAVARLLEPFGARLAGVHRSAVDASTLPAGMRLVTVDRMEEAMATADVVVMAATHTPGQPAVLSAKRLAAVKHGAIVINVARGAAIDNDACLAALDSGALSGLGIDVFPVEPYPGDGPLASHPKVLATAHIAALTTGYFEAGSRRLGEAIASFQAGIRPANELTGRE